MSPLQILPDFFSCVAILDRLMLGGHTFHEKECLDSKVVQFPMAVSTRFQMRVRSRKRAIKVLIQEGKLKDAHDVAAAGCIVICGLVEYSNIPPT